MGTITTGALTGLLGSWGAGVSAQQSASGLLGSWGAGVSAQQSQQSASVFNQGFTGTSFTGSSGGQVYAEPPKVYKNDVEKAIADIVAELKHV